MGWRVRHTLLCLVLLWATGLLESCAPPPEEPEDLLPCTFLRRQVCGAQNECVTADPGEDDCEQCKADLCAFVRALEANNDHGQCVLEWRSRPAYPVCRFPGPFPTPPTPPFVYPIYCERECSLIPYPPKPRWAP
jgi:hypothetical protein